jgi:pimeloyl-ACP methyl ester carboxylesterase
VAGGEAAGDGAEEFDGGEDFEGGVLVEVRREILVAGEHLMKKIGPCFSALLAVVVLSRSVLCAQKPAGDSSPHTIQFVTVDSNIRLEVLDWGGSGRPLVLLTGLRDNAHVFDNFAPKLTANYHVYGITRRGFGSSTAPPPNNRNYDADRLGDDVLEVVEALKIKRPVLVGHSIAGEELSSIGSRYPEKISGLIYLDAGYMYAFYDAARGDFGIELNTLRKQLEQLSTATTIRERKAQVKELTEVSLPQFEKEIQMVRKELQDVPDATVLPTLTPQMQIYAAIIQGEQKYTEIRCPALAIFAFPRDPGPAFKDDPNAAVTALSEKLAEKSAQANAFEAGIPSAHVVRLANADHYVFRSNEADVLREINAFVAKLPQ